MFTHAVNMESMDTATFSAISLVLLLGSVHGADGKLRVSPGCQPLTVTVCQTFGYKETLVPNALHRGSQSDANREIGEYTFPITLRCSPYLKFFLCSFYLPECSEGQTLLPCRSLCEKARSGCESLLNKYGHQWPEAFACQSFPEESCIREDSRFEGLTVQEVHSRLAKTSYMVGDEALSLDTSRILVSLMDTDESETITVEELRELEKHVLHWRRIFASLDRRHMDFISLDQLRAELRSAGVLLPPESSNAVWQRYGSDKGMRYNEFVACVTRLRSLTDAFKKRLLNGLPSACEVASFTYDDFIKKTIL